MLDWIFRITNITLPIATMFCSTWALVSDKGEGAFLLFLGGMGMTVALRYTEQEIFENNKRNGYYN